MKRIILLSISLLLIVSGCNSKKKNAADNSKKGKTQKVSKKTNKKNMKNKKAAKTDKTNKKNKTTFNQINRETFNRVAVRLNIPVYWIQDSNNNKTLEPMEVASLLFYSTSKKWVEKGKFTKDFIDAYKKIVKAAKAPLPADERLKLVISDLDQGRPTLVMSDLRKLDQNEKVFLKHMLKVASLMDLLYKTQLGISGLESKIKDPASRRLFDRNWGPKCKAPKTENNPKCTAIPGYTKVPAGIYPASLQAKKDFCKLIQKDKNAKALMNPFNVVKEKDGKLVAVPYTEAFKTLMGAVSKELKAAAASIKDPKEEPLKKYLTAAAQSFLDNNWQPADEAWSKMNALNSKWYVRVAPDEVYWDPCNLKAGFHLTFALINRDSLAWQKKLKPAQQKMEDALAKLIGAPYKARKVTFHLPDFIDIVLNAGNDRNAFGATIGQSLPNWGPVANEGRGRTVAMSNLYTDPDSLSIRMKQAKSLLSAESMKYFVSDPAPGLLSTILHEATHNLGPAHEYKFKGKKDTEIFGGALATTLEELKAQTGALWFLNFLKEQKILDEKLVNQSYVNSFFWTMGHISRGMYTSSKKPRPYSQLAAIQVGFLMDEKAVEFKKDVKSADGKESGAFVLHLDKFPAAVNKLMKIVGDIKAKGDKAKAEELIKKYVDGTVVPHELIKSRILRYPKASFVYSVITD